MMDTTPVPEDDRAVAGRDERPSSETLAGVEHDLYDALAVVVARSQLMRRRVGAGRVDPAELLAGLAAVERAARRMTDGIGRLAGERAPVPRQGPDERPAEWTAPAPPRAAPN